MKAFLRLPRKPFLMLHQYIIAFTLAIAGVVEVIVVLLVVIIVVAVGVGVL